MARSPLSRRLAFALQAFRRSRRNGMPIDEIVQRCDGAITRRQFVTACLGASAAAFGVNALAGCGAARYAGGQKVAIVGAGIAGLHCAYRLRRAGIQATVYEAANRVGGRIISDRTTFNGQHCELGGELIDTGHETMHRLAKELGIRLLDYSKDDPALDDCIGFVAGKKLSRAEMVSGFAPIAKAIDGALAGLKDADAGVTRDDPNGGEALDRMSLSAWLDEVRAGGPMRRILETAYTIEFGLDPDRNNVLNMLLMISTEAEKLALFGDSDERFHAAGGNDLFISKLAAELDGAQIKSNHVLERIGESADGRFVLSFKRGAAATEVAADHVVLALPFSILRTIPIYAPLSDAKRRAIAEIGYGMNTKLMVGFSARPWRDQGSSGQVFADLPFQNAWDTSRLQPGSEGIITNFTGGARAVEIANGTTEAQASAFIRQFDLVLPGAQATANGNAARMAWYHQPWVRGSYSSYLVGQYTSFAGVEPERAGNLHFCGEHTCLDAQGYMEGGALSGQIAAAEVAADLGVKIAAPAPRARDRRVARMKRLRSFTPSSAT